MCRMCSSGGCVLVWVGLALALSSASLLHALLVVIGGRFVVRGWCHGAAGRTRGLGEAVLRAEDLRWRREGRR